jgi:hypothetical protein
MSIVAKVAAELQTLLGRVAEQVARQVPVVQRRRKFSPATLARTFILGFLAKPHPSDEDLARTAALCGVAVSPQAIAQRFTHTLVAFLEALFRAAVRQSVQAERRLAPLLERFPGVILQDSTTITLPDELRDRFPGCGGSHGRGQAAMKLQVQLDLRSGDLTAIEVEPGKNCDQRTRLQSVPLAAGTLRIADLGYFDTRVFQGVEQQGGFWISRLAFGTDIFLPGATRSISIDALFAPGTKVVDRPIVLGKEAQLHCRIVAWRVPEEVANRRRQKLIETARDKGNPPPSRARLAWCDWTIFVTNVPCDRLSAREIGVLYRARWQIELMFKRWKSLGRVADLRGSTVERQLVGLWSRLLAMLVQHWLLVGCAWGDRHCSLHKACRTIRELVSHVMTALDVAERLIEEIERLREILGKLARRDKRKQPGTFELLNDPSLLGYES